MDQNNEPKSPETLNNYDDFDNMWKGIQNVWDRHTYTAVLIVDKVKLERNPIRSHDVDNWYRDVFFGDRVLRPPPFYNEDSDVSDIED